jgi:hypothetical protein
MTKAFAQANVQLQYLRSQPHLNRLGVPMLPERFRCWASQFRDRNAAGCSRNAVLIKNRATHV